MPKKTRQPEREKAGGPEQEESDESVEEFKLPSILRRNRAEDQKLGRLASAADALKPQPVPAEKGAMPPVVPDVLSGKLVPVPVKQRISAKMTTPGAAVVMFFMRRVAEDEWFVVHSEQRAVGGRTLVYWPRNAWRGRVKSTGSYVIALEASTIRSRGGYWQFYDVDVCEPYKFLFGHGDELVHRPLYSAAVLHYAKIVDQFQRQSTWTGLATGTKKPSPFDFFTKIMLIMGFVCCIFIGIVVGLLLYPRLIVAPPPAVTHTVSTTTSMIKSAILSLAGGAGT